MRKMFALYSYYFCCLCYWESEITFLYFVILIQESIVHEINANPNAGWKAAMNPQFSNYTVSPKWLSSLHVRVNYFQLRHIPGNC